MPDHGPGHRATHGRRRLGEHPGGTSLSARAGTCTGVGGGGGAAGLVVRCRDRSGGSGGGARRGTAGLVVAMGSVCEEAGWVGWVLTERGILVCGM